MRKALLGLAVLTAGAVTCVAQQNVYSLNIVGYVNVPVAANQLTLLSNPLKPSNGNYNITNTIVLPDAATDATLYKWAGASWSPDVPQWYGASGGWFPDMTIPLGESFFIRSPAAATVTFVGEVATGTNSYAIPSGLSFVANKVPVAEPFPGNVGNENDNIYLWGGTAWSSTVWQYYGSAFGWSAGGLTDDTNGPVVAIGGGVAYRNGGAPLNFTRTFNVQ